MIAQQTVVSTPAPPGGPAKLSGDPAEIYRALREQGGVLREQQQHLQGERQNLQEQLDQMNASNPGRAGIEKRLSQVDARIADLDQQIAKSDQAVAQAVGVPGATREPPFVPRSGPDPDMIVGMSTLILMTVLIPITIAYARRIWRRSARTEVALSPVMMDRLDSLERGMEAIALEVERIGEGQRFVTQALSGRALGAGEAEPVVVARGERLEQRR